MREPTRSDYAHVTPIKVKWGEMDSLGHVNNAVFFRYSEDGRIDYIHRITEGSDTQISDGPILADLQCSFRRQLHFPADVEIGTRVGGQISALSTRCLCRQSRVCRHEICFNEAFVNRLIAQPCRTHNIATIYRIVNGL